MLKIYCSFLIIIVLVFFNISCSSGPSDRDIKKAVSISLQKRVPVSLARHLTGGSNAEIGEIKVIQVGNVFGEGNNKYWPVKVYVKGNCTVMFGGRKNFEGEAEYNLRMDAYENWQAEPKGL